MAGFTLFGPTHHLLSTSMRLRAARHEVLTANIANAETPGYRARDLEFADILTGMTQPDSAPSLSHSAASDVRAGRVVLATTHRQHLPQGGDKPSTTNGKEAERRLDENGVDLDYEIAQMTENALLHETSTTIMSKLIGKLRYAIGEGRSA